MSDKPFALSVKVLIRDAKRRCLVLQRSPSSKNNPGLWDFPGGKVDAGEEFATALKREVAEETGLTIRLTGLAGCAQSEAPTRIVVYLIMDAEHVGGTVSLSDEHTDSRWVVVSELPEIGLSPQFRKFAISLATGVQP